MDWWIGSRWVAREIHPHISATIVLCCVSNVTSSGLTEKNEFDRS